MATDDPQKNDTSPPPRPRRRWWRWLRRILLTVLLLLVIVIAFHRPILRWGIGFAAQRWTSGEGLTFSGSVGGSVISDLALAGLRIGGREGKLIREISVGKFDADYDLWALRQGVGSVLKSLTIEDAVVDLDLTAPPAGKEKPAESGKASEFPKIDLPVIHLHNVTVRLRQAGGILEIAGLDLDLDRSKPGVVHVATLAIPEANIHWNNLAGESSVAGNTFTWKHLTMDRPLVIEELTADLATLDAAKIPLRLAVARGETTVTVEGTIAGLNAEPHFDGTATLHAVTPESLADFMILPPDPAWRADDAVIEWHGPFISPAAIHGRLQLDAGPLTVAGFAMDDGRLDASLDGPEWKIGRLVIKRGADEITANGSMKPPVQWGEGWDRLTLSSAAQWNLPQIAALFTEKPPVAGASTGKGTFAMADGKIAGITADVSAAPLIVADRTISTVALQATGDAQTTHVTALKATVEDHTTLTATGSLGWAEPQPVNATWEANVSEIAPLLAWAGVALEPTITAGRVTSKGSATGTLAAWKMGDFSTDSTASASVTALGVAYGGGTLESAQIDASLAGGTARADRIAVQFDPENRIAASGSYRLSEPRAFSGSVDGSLAKLAALSAWSQGRGGPKIEAGAFDLHWEGQGQLTDFQLNGAGSLKADGVKLSTAPYALSASAAVTHEAKTLRLSGLSAKSGPFALSAEATASPDVIEIPKLTLTREKITLATGSVTLPLKMADGVRVPLDPERDLAVDFQSRQLNVAELLKSAGIAAPVTATVTSDLTAKGRWPEPEIALHVDATGIAAAAEGGPKIDPATASIDVGYAKKRITGRLDARQPLIQPLQAEVSLPMALDAATANPDAIMDAPLTGSLTLPASDLAAAKSFVPALRTIRGTAAANFKATGTPRAPHFSGAMTVSAPEITFNAPKLPELRDVRVEIAGEDRIVRLRECRGTVAGGQVTAGGTVDWTQPANPQLDLTAKASEALIVRDDLMSVRANADIACRGRLDSAAISGRVDLVRGRVFKEVEFLPLSLPGQLPPPPPAAVRRTVEKKEPSLLDKWTLDVAVATQDPIRLLGNVLNGDVIVNCRIGGTIGQPWVEGRAHTDNARVRLPFSRLTVTKANVDFSKEHPFEPTLDLSGDSFVSGYQVTVNATGPALDPKLRLSSSPPLPEGDIATLLATGATTGDLRGAQGEAANRAAFLLISQTYRKLFKKAGLPSDVDKEPPRLNFSFSVLETGNSQRGVTATYEISPHWQAAGTIGERGTFRGLLYYLIRFR